jgi:type IV pilus assembly protein PilC
MPYFVWKGVDLQVKIQKGIQFAANERDLDALLFKKDIALLSFSCKKVWFDRPIPLQLKIDYFMQLALLLNAGILLPQALKLLAEQSAHPTFTPILHEVTQTVHQGISLSNAFKKHSHIFSILMIQMASVGQESGNLAVSLQVLTSHLESVAFFKARLRAALMLPAITFAFFMVIIGIILAVIVPQFVSLFASMHKELPTSTKAMVMISDFFYSWYLGLTIVMGSGIIFLLNNYTKTVKGKDAFDRLVMKLPFSGAIIINQSMAGFFQSLSLLLQGGMPLVQAIKIAKESIRNGVIKNQIHGVEQEVNAGGSFAQTLAKCEQLCVQEMVSLIQVGHESGKLADMLARVAHMYQARLMRTLSRINTLFQPFLLIILGLMIAGLILALYTPIMSLSYAV